MKGSLLMLLKWTFPKCVSTLARKVYCPLPGLCLESCGSLPTKLRRAAKSND